MTVRHASMNFVRDAKVNLLKSQRKIKETVKMLYKMRMQIRNRMLRNRKTVREDTTIQVYVCKPYTNVCMCVCVCVCVCVT